MDRENGVAALIPFRRVARMTEAIVPDIVGKVVLAAAVAVLAISNAVVYRKYRRAVEACGLAGGKQEKAQRWTTVSSEEGPKEGAGGSGRDGGAKEEGTVGSSGTFADLCEDRQDVSTAKGAADRRD